MHREYRGEYGEGHDILSSVRKGSDDYRELRRHLGEIQHSDEPS